QQLAAGSQQLQLDTRSLPAGVYLLRIVSGERVRTLRVVKGE
ncbi:MAG: T9SS type A sorting domain-containing protein, partial [Bacteroidia bacterium]